jgi:glutaredoxin
MNSINLMKKFPLIIGLVTILIIVGGIFLFSKRETPPSLPTSYEYFWGEGCPHCKNVDDFLSTWSGKDQFKLDKMEIHNNSVNANKLSVRAQSCNITGNDVGIPFLFTPEGKCIVGDVDIINFFKSLSPEPTNTESPVPSQKP